MEFMLPEKHLSIVGSTVNIGEMLQRKNFTRPRCGLLFPATTQVQAYTPQILLRKNAPDFLSFFINNLYRGLYVGCMCHPGYQNWLPFQRRAE
jgi:hypothetical protein